VRECAGWKRQSEHQRQFERDDHLTGSGTLNGTTTVTAVNGVQHSATSRSNRRTYTLQASDAALGTALSSRFR